jgi:hypothetical protein
MQVLTWNRPGLTVRFVPSPHPVYPHGFTVIVDFVYNAVIADPNAIQVFAAGNFADAGGPGRNFQTLDGAFYPVPDSGRKPFQFF